jgi:nitrite reductase (NADH) small subunit/3-phenylpropionate/trans-cinnamate dioxygenase ferredoxin subunit
VARVEEFDTGLALADLDPERPLPVETPWGSIALYVVGGEVLASQSFCPHLEGPLFQGTRSGETITCPWHLWRFSLRSGERLDAGGLLSRGRDALLVCDVRVGDRGTLVLARPRRAGQSFR